jgi:hypothetical protein
MIPTSSMLLKKQVWTLTTLAALALALAVLGVWSQVL